MAVMGSSSGLGDGFSVLLQDGGGKAKDDDRGAIGYQDAGEHDDGK
jgi:hypothetical protein